MPCPRYEYRTPSDFAPLKKRLEARRDPDASVEDTVRTILDDVEARGDEALADYARRFDCPDFTADRLAVPPHALAEARSTVPAEDLAIMQEAIAKVRRFHEHQTERSWWMTDDDGAVLGQLVRPVDRVGLYVPGGKGGETPLVSSLIMNAVPAQVAGVGEIVAATPPRADGSVNPLILACAELLGIQRVVAAGSAWAVAALAFGTDTVPACDVIAGPGNIFVATAKSLLTGRVGIDMVAGPSEIAILADASADPSWLAADMLSQAEHDPLAAALCITPDQALGDAVAQALADQLSALPRAGLAARSLADWGGIVLVPDLDTGLELANALAPEHLELAVADPWALVPRVRHAGAVFLGHHTPEPVGDYFAGPNHVLPTLGTARFSSALSVQTFCKKTSLVATTPGYLDAHGAKIARLARLEGLDAHARSVEARTRKA